MNTKLFKLCLCQESGVLIDLNDPVQILILLLCNVVKASDQLTGHKVQQPS